MRAVENLNSSTSSLSSTFERLSSGLRINRAADDAAGLAVSSALNVKSRVLNRAQLNISDATSFLTIADGALSQIGGLLTRMGELSAQAANGSFSRAQRISLNDEYSALDKEIRRIAASTKFNGISPFKGRAVDPTSELIISSSYSPAEEFISANGRYVAFQDNSLSPAGLAVYDSVTGTTTSIDASDLGYTGAINPRGVTNDGKVLFRQADAASATKKDLFLYDTTTGDLTKLTNSLNATDNAGASISADGSTVAFLSKTIYTNGGTSDSASGTTANFQLYVVDVDSGVLRGIQTDLVNYTAAPKLNADGTRLAIATTDDLAGNGVPLFAEVFSVNLLDDTLSYTQLTSGSTENHIVRGLDLDGNVISYQSTAADIYRTSADGSSSSLLLDLDVITNFQVGTDGTTLILSSSDNITGENAGAYRQAFQYDLTTGEMRQLTNYTSFLNQSFTFAQDGSAFIYGNGASGYSIVDLTQQDSEFSFEAGYGSVGAIAVALGDLRSQLGILGGNVITSQDSAAYSLDSVTSAIETLATLRGEIGSGLARMETASRLLSSSAAENKAAEARIVEADIADETASLTRYQILQQSASALLGQANLQPQLVLTLLEGV